MGSGDHLPEEIIAEILVKLPVKSIIRFQTVSKSWFDLVKSTCFIRKHKIESDEIFPAMCFVDPRRWRWDWDDNENYNYAPSAVYVSSGINFELSSSYDFFLRQLEGDLILTWDVAGDCNGILCLTDYKSIVLVNPSCKEAKRLPNHILPEVGNPPGDWFCDLVGFGFDDTTNDLKVVRVMSCWDNWHGVNVERVEVYSNLRSNSSSWRELNDIPLPAELVRGTGCYCNASTFFNGVIHWCDDTSGIFTFNMANNLFNQLECPQAWYEYDDTRENKPS